MQHYLRPLLRPESIALVGASDRVGSLGRTVYENLLRGSYAGRLYAVNPRHATVLDRPAYASLAAIGAPIDLAIVATPPRAVCDVLEAAGAAGVKVAVVMTAPAGIDTQSVRAWSDDVAAAARRARVRVVGAGALGVIRPESGVNATYCVPVATPGHLALVAQSGAVAAAMLDFAMPLGIGFSYVISLGGGIDIGFGELLDLLLQDAVTDGILLYVEDPGDTRTFMSALRAAARTKPVVVLKAGRSLERPAEISQDAVFDAALKRAGTVRVATYTQLFAAARILARGRIPRGERLAIVSNGRGPALLAADRAAEQGIPLAVFARETSARLDALLADDAPHANPLDVRDAPPERQAAVVAAALDDPNVDVAVALHVPRPNTVAMEAAHALADVARSHAKPVLAAWLGAIDRREVHHALEAGGVSNFFTPENAVDALSFLASYRNNQAWLLEVPPPQPEPQPLDLSTVEAVRVRLAEQKRARLTVGEAREVLAAFGIGRFAVVATLQQATEASQAMRLPFVLEFDTSEPMPPSARRPIRMRRMLAKAFAELSEHASASPPPAWTGRFVLSEAARDSAAGGAALGVSTDARFGPVIWIGPGHVPHGLARHRSLMLPPLNARLAADLVAAAAAPVKSAMAPEVVDGLVDALTRISALVCALPWVRGLVLDPVIVSGSRAYVGTASFDVDPARKLLRGYPHMAIHPYPVELIGDVTLRDGAVLHVRPIRPEDADMERAFVNGLSEQTRYFRFFYRLAELTPAMLARFTQVDYDRELALVAIAAQDDGAFVGVARYIANPDRTSAEFAVVTADAWQRRGVARVLMRGLIVCAKRRGFTQMTGSILRVNEPMLEFVRSLGFVLEDDPEDPAQVNATLALA